ncbi:MAG: polysaccharide biosynthesis/export family protein [Phycisphaerae bacterium]
MAILLATGCAPTHGQLVAFLRSNDAAVSTGHYTVNPPDAITIHAPGAGEIDGVMQQVRPDGKVSLRLLGEVQVAGLTTQEIAEKLEAQLSRYYIEPEVVVEVSQYRSQRYYVFGEVGSPGPKPYTGRDTLLTALAQASPTFLAWRSQIRVVRPAPDGKSRKTIVVDLDEMIRGGGADQNVLLQPGDIIEVPPTPLAWLGLRVRELLYPVTPALRAYESPAEALSTTEEYEAYRTRGDTDDGLRRLRNR